MTLFDYRSFLNSRYLHQKNCNAKFSARYFARKTGMSSPSYFSMIISGKRKLSSKFAIKVAKALKLSEPETLLLLKAVELETSENANQKLRLINDINKLSSKIKFSQEMPENHLQILSRPLELSLYVLSQSTKFKYDAFWIHSQPGFSAFKISSLKKAMQVLVDSGLWTLDGKSIQIRPPDLETGSRQMGPALMLSHLRFLEISKSALTKKTPDQRVFLAQTFLCNPQRMTEIEKKLMQFKSELEMEFEDLNSTSVYQLNLGFYPFNSSEAANEL